jgi:hypothetical protein
MQYSHQASSQKDDRVDQTNYPSAVGNPCAVGIFETKFNRKAQIGTVGTRLIPALGASSDGAQADRVPQHLGTMPFVIALVDECIALGLVELTDRFEAVNVTCHKGGFGEESGMLGHAIGFGKEAGIIGGYFLGDTLEGLAGAFEG